MASGDQSCDLIESLAQAAPVAPRAAELADEVQGRLAVEGAAMSWRQHGHRTADALEVLVAPALRHGRHRTQTHVRPARRRLAAPAPAAPGQSVPLTDPPERRLERGELNAAMKETLDFGASWDDSASRDRRAAEGMRSYPDSLWEQSSVWPKASSLDLPGG